MTRIALIQGASRGIGLQYCKSLLSRDSQSVVLATCRNPGNAPALSQLQQEHANRLFVHQLDVSKSKDIEHVCKLSMEKFGKLDLLINSAGMLHPSGRGETSLRDVTMEVI